MKKVMREDVKKEFIESVIGMVTRYDMTIDNINESIEEVKEYMEQEVISMENLIAIAKEQVEILIESQNKTTKPDDLVELSREIRQWTHTIRELEMD